MTPEDRPPEDKLIPVINESAKYISTITISFLVAGVYIAVAAASTTHKMLLLGDDIGLPLFSVKVPLIHFYLAAPSLLLVLHLHLLLQEYFLTSKVLPRPGAAADGLALIFFPSLSVVRMLGYRYDWGVRVLLRVIRWTILAILPLAIFIWLQVQFVAYHCWLMTLCHQGFVIADLWFIGYFHLKIATQRRQYLQDGPRKWIARWVSGILIAGILAFSTLVAVPYGNSERWWPFGWPARNLSLREFGEVRGANLSKRNLKQADFSGARLPYADFRGSDLAGAIFVNADLKGAKFMPQGGADGRFDRDRGEDKRRLIEEAEHTPRTFFPTNLEGADFRGAHLEGANLILAKLMRAKLSGAHLAGVELTRADLQGAELRRSELPGAELWGAKLDGADLTEADLRAVTLSFASLAYTLLTDARLIAADLRHADLSGARLVGAHLEAADLHLAETVGVNFRGGHLEAARGLKLVMASVRQATIDLLCKESGLPPPTLVDFREVALAETPGVLDNLAGVPEGISRNEALKRLNEQPVRTACPQGEAVEGGRLKHLGLLYNDRQRPGFLADWPEPSEQRIGTTDTWDEDAFDLELAKALVEAACSNTGLARGLIRDAEEPASLEPKFQAYLIKRLAQGIHDAEAQERRRKKGEIVTNEDLCRPLLEMSPDDKAQIRKLVRRLGT